ncbi:glycosyl hydrolase [Herbidospora mongoliensis]|uniref:glycosyl hydrolase n=1 Tax=Herbidospora mongoliensis TaxID=688067 RepID=UPI0008327DC0|nr:glycosyl hydrolase [Herbidospora mongoliensis]
MRFARLPARLRRRNIFAAVAVALTATTVAAAAAAPAVASAGCRVQYAVTNQWPGGFGTNITVTNLGDPLSGWQLRWSFTAGQTIVQGWNAAFSQSGSAVTAANAPYNAELASGASVGIGFNGNWNGSNPTPGSFTLNGVACTGSVTGSPSPSASPSRSPSPSPTPSPSPSGNSCSAAPVNPNANAATRRVLCYLYSQYGNHILSGQQESTWIGGPDYEINYIRTNTGKYPAIRALDFGDSKDLAPRAVAYWNAGGLVMIGYHMGAPTQPDTYAGSQGTASINNTLTAGTSENTVFRQRLDQAAAMLQQLQSNGVSVIWRPFHEAGGTWFWWSKEGGAQYNRLWRYMYDYFTTTKGLNNLIWLHGYNGQPQSAFYPGKQYVDVGGADTYAGDGNYDPQKAMYDNVRTIVGTTVPIALHENGPIPDPDRLQSTGARWVLFGTWHGNHLTVSNSVSHLNKVYNHSYVVTRDELPNFR